MKNKLFQYKMFLMITVPVQFPSTVVNVRKKAMNTSILTVGVLMVIASPALAIVNPIFRLPGKLIDTVKFSF